MMHSRNVLSIKRNESVLIWKDAHEKFLVFKASRSSFHCIKKTLKCIYMYVYANMHISDFIYKHTRNINFADLQEIGNSVYLKLRNSFFGGETPKQISLTYCTYHE